MLIMCINKINIQNKTFTLEKFGIFNVHTKKLLFKCNCFSCTHLPYAMKTFTGD